MPTRDPVPATLPDAPLPDAHLPDAPLPAALDAHGYNPDDYDWVPVLKKARTDGWTPQKQRAFIGTLADCGSVRTAAMQVGISPSSAYKLRRSPGGEAFAQAWDAAIQQAAYALIDDAFERAFNGSDEPVYGRDGQVIGLRRRKSDAMAMFLLRKHFPDRYGDLHRDRPDRAIAAPLPRVADTMVALGPVEPADPVALLDPETAADRLTMADIMGGTLPRWQRQDGSIEAAADAAGGAAGDDTSLGDAFEAALEEAKHAADPEGHARADAMRAAIDALDEEMADRRARTGRHRGIFQG